MAVDWKGIGKWVVVMDIVLVNVGVGFQLYKSPYFAKATQGKQTSSNGQIPSSQVADRCGEECQRYIENRVMSFDLRIKDLEAGASATPVPTTVQAKQVQQAKQAKIRTVAYVTIPGSGRSAKFDWEDLAGTEFYFDSKDYPGLVEAYFEASMSLFNGNGRADVRLFDASHGIGVQGSGVETGSQATTVVQSGKLSFWAGKNLYRVQAKTLTSDTAIFSYGRLRVVTEN